MALVVRAKGLLAPGVGAKGLLALVLGAKGLLALVVGAHGLLALCAGAEDSRDAHVSTSRSPPQGAKFGGGEAEGTGWKDAEGLAS